MNFAFADLPSQSIRYWKKIGLISDKISSASLKPLKFEDLVKIRFIMNCRKNGISLQKIQKSIEMIPNNETQVSAEVPAKESSKESISWHHDLFLYHSYCILKKEKRNIYEPLSGQLFLSFHHNPSAEPSLPARSPLKRNLSNMLDFHNIHRSHLGAVQTQEKKIQKLEEEYLNHTRETDASGGDFRISKKILENILRLDKDYVPALLELGNLYLSRTKSNVALRYYEKALHHEPHNEQILYNIANVYLKQKKYVVARRYLLDTIRIAPEFKEAYYNLGMLYYFLFAFEEAIGSLKIYIILEDEASMKEYARTFIEHCKEMSDEGTEHFNR